MIGPLAAGFLLSAGVAVAARALRLLTHDGVLAAVAIGTLVFGFGGWKEAGLLALFFATSSLLTRWHARRKPHPEHAAGRSAPQVLANGSVATLLAVWGSALAAPWVSAAFAGAIAASTADTWATEIGLLSRTPPQLITARLLRTRTVVPPGTSGGVTWLGTIAACAGAALIAGSSTVWLDTRFASVWLAGVVGMTLDSTLGATAEGRWRWMTNDTVNLIASIGGALLAAVL
jgi:uncharacterized protein (TIGR00297 family)